MGTLADILSWLLIGGGVVFLLIGGIGLLRLPDFYARMHPAGITDTAGAGLVLLGLMVQAGPTIVTVKLIVILLCVLVASPTATHAAARAARAAGLAPWTGPDDSPRPFRGTRPDKDA